MRGRNGLYTCRMVRTIMNTKASDTTTPHETNTAVLLITDSLHDPFALKLVTNGSSGPTVLFLSQLKNKKMKILKFNLLISRFGFYLLQIVSKSKFLLSITSLLQKRVHISSLSIISQWRP